MPVPKNSAARAVVRPFAVGQSVDYRNHVAGYRIFPLTVVQSTEDLVVAKSEGGRTFKFTSQGMATWSSNLSIAHWPEAGLDHD